MDDFRARLEGVTLVVLDLDGTVLDEEFRPHPEVVRQIERLRSRVRVTLATGRGYQSASRYARELGIESPIIVMDGGLVRTPDGGEPIHRAPVCGPVCTPLLKFLRELPGFYLIYGEDQAYLPERFLDYRDTMTRWGFVPEIVSEDTLDGIEIFRFIAAGERNVLEALRARIDSLDTRELFAYIFPCRSLPWNFMDIRSHQASKGYGLKRLMHHLGYKKSDVLCFGDFLNDIQLFQECGVKVAMNNSVPELKEMADYVTRGSNQEGGAAEVLRMIEGPIRRNGAHS
jgi:Cof subfamily protein (haloacid dehalogenase superfamily)